MASAAFVPLTLQTPEGDVALELNGRALPYRPLRIGGRQRAEFTWYPGSAAAIVQMLGPEEEPVTMNGMWKERFLSTAEGAPQATLNGTAIYSVSQLVETVDGLRRGGRKLKLSWDRLVRYGHITGFWQSWDTFNDCAWELEFSVSAQEAESQPVALADPVSVTSVAFTVNQQYNRILDLTLDEFQPSQVPTAGNPVGLNLSEQLRAAMFLAQQQVNTFVGKVTGTATNLANQVLLPMAAARAVSAAASDGIVSISAAASSISNRALGELFNFTEGQNNTPIGSQVAGATYQRQWTTALNAIIRSTAITRYQTEKQLQQELVASFVADRELDFRDVSLMYYGTQDGWRDLMLHNGYATSRIAPGDLVWVMQRSYASGGGGPAGSAGRPTAG